MSRLLIVDGRVIDAQTPGRARAITGELELAVREEGDRHHGQLARLVEASLAITSALSLEHVAATTVDAIRTIFGATGRVVIDHGGRKVCAGPEAPSDSGVGVTLLAPAIGEAVGGILEVDRPSADFDLSERLVAAHLHLVTLASAQRVLLMLRATEKARERQEIVAIVSHDLRTPLQTFSMGLDAIEHLTTRPEKSPIDETVARMKRSIATMARLLEDLLDVSRIHDGALPLRVAPCPIEPLIEELCAQQLPLAQKKKLTLIVEIEPGLRMVCDGERLSQALGNLLSNALRFTERGSIVVRARKLGADRVRIEVTDSGPGVAPEVRDRLFERLYQGATSGRAGGLGLGLYIVRGIALAHGGVVGLDNEVGRGSTFFLDLPCDGPPAAAPSV